MAKPFLTYDQQLHKLSKDKNLQISDIDFARQKLKEVGYFALIGGYICLTEANYNPNFVGSKQLKKLINKLDYVANHDTEHTYVVHQRTTYHNVPLWVTLNVMTFGQISHLYSMLPFALQSDVSKEYSGINERQLEQYLAALTLFRNVCAHNERLYSYKLRKDFPNTTLHRKLMIPQKGQQYTNGKRDYYGVFIAFRYLLSDQSFREYKSGLFKLVDRYCRTTTRLTRDELMTSMGFAGKWQNIMRYKR